MKVAIQNGNELIRSIVQSVEQFTDVVVINSFDDVKEQKKVKALLLEHHGLTSHDLLVLRQQFPDLKILIVSKQNDEFFVRTCITHDILFVKEELGEQKIRDIIQENWFDKNETHEFQNVIVIHGTHRQVGCTQTALSIGYALSELNYKVGVLGLNPYNPGELRNLESPHSFDVVYDLVESGVIKSGDLLVKYMTKIDRLYYLIGNRDFYRGIQYQKEPVEGLIHMAKEYFDVVILDIGGFYDSYLSYTALTHSGSHILIGTQEYLSIVEFKRWREQYLNRLIFNAKNRYFIVNKYASRAIITPKILSETHDVPLLSMIPYFPEAADAEYEDGLLIKSDYKPYAKAIHGIAKSIAEDVKNFEATTDDKTFFGLIKKKVMS